MKQIKLFRKDEKAVSPVMGVLLMVVLTVMLAVIVLAMMNSFGSVNNKLPMSYLSVKQNYDIDTKELKLVFGNGGAIPAGNWWISVVPNSKPASLVRSDIDLSGGTTINIVFETEGTGTYSMKDGNLKTDGIANPLVTGIYDIKIIDKVSNIVLYDRMVEIK